MTAYQKKPQSSVLERLEGRQLFSAAAPGLSAGDALSADAGGAPEQAVHVELTSAGKVSMQDFHFVSRVNKSSPTLRIKLTDVLVSGYGVSADGADASSTTAGFGAGKVSMQDFSFTAKVSKSTPG
jgi:hypothetical protein